MKEYNYTYTSIHYGSQKSIYADCSCTHLTSIVGSLDDLSVGGRIISLDVRVDGLLHHGGFQLSLGQLAPHGWLVATLGKFISTVQVTNMVDEHLGKGRKWRDEVG